MTEYRAHNHTAPAGGVKRGSCDRWIARRPPGPCAAPPPPAEWRLTARTGGLRMHWIADPQVWIALVTLTAMEIVLGIDNIIFISILAGKLPHNRQNRARVLGLGVAM